METPTAFLWCIVPMLVSPQSCSPGIENPGADVIVRAILQGQFWRLQALSGHQTRGFVITILFTLIRLADYRRQLQFRCLFRHLPHFCRHISPFSGRFHSRRFLIETMTAVFVLACLEWLWAETIGCKLKVAKIQMICSDPPSASSKTVAFHLGLIAIALKPLNTIRLRF